MTRNDIQLSAFDLLLFDLDGTLVDSAADITAAVDDTLLARNWPAAGVERVRSWIGNGSRKLIERAVLFATNSSDTELLNAVHDEFLAHYTQHNGANTSLFSGAREFLQHCQTINKKMACITNKPELLAKALLQQLNLDSYFSIIIGGDTFPQRKPDPTALLHCCEQLTTSIERTLMIGDSETDVKSARNAGMKVLCVSYGYNHGGAVAATNPDWLIDDFRELISA